MSKQQLDVSGRPVALRDVDLDTFFRPKKVVAIGASDSDRAPNSAMWRKIRTWADANGAEAIPVHPKKESIDGVKAYRSILDVPGEVDLAAILTSNVLDVMPEVAEKKAKFAVVFAAGFRETGAEGAKLQAKLETIIEESDTHVLGPNTNLNAFELFDDSNPGRAIALITQSGHQGRPIYQAQQLGIRLSHWAPVGNEADLEFSDFASYFVHHPDVGVVAAYIEGFKDGRTLMLAADEAAKQGVPIVAVKVGRTDEGQSMAQSHTGHLTGSDKVVDAVFRQFGVTRVTGLDELQDTAALFARTSPPTGDGVCIYSISGGTGAQMADMAAAVGLRLPELSAKTQKRLREHIPGYLRVSNPVDSGGGASSREPSGPAILDAILEDPDIDMLIVPITGALPAMSDPFAKHLVAANEKYDKPILVVWGSPIGDEEAYRDILLGSDLPVFRTFGNCVNAARAYFDYHGFRERYRSPFDKPRKRRGKGYKQASELLAGGKALSEHASKQLLAAYGIPTTTDVLASSAKEAAEAASQLGLPVVMKVSSPDLLHKSDLGLVEVGVSSQKEARETYKRLLERAEAADADAEIEGVIVSELVDDGVETVIGVSQDPLFGPTVMFGLGGIFVEVLQDVTFRVPPFDQAEARRMVEEVKGYPLLTGARGRQKVDVKALVKAIMAVQNLALDCADELAELDLNPFVVRPKGAVALDALAVPTR